MVGPDDTGHRRPDRAGPGRRTGTTYTNTVHSDLSPSPRVFPIPLYDPNYYDNGKQNGRNADLKMANWLGFFVVERQGNNVFGRITPILGVVDEDAGPAPEGSFPQSIRLVE